MSTTNEAFATAEDVNLYTELITNKYFKINTSSNRFFFFNKNDDLSIKNVQSKITGFKTK